MKKIIIGIVMFGVICAVVAGITGSSENSKNNTERIITEVAKTDKTQTQAILKALNAVGIDSIDRMKRDDMQSAGNEALYVLKSNGVDKIFVYTKDNIVTEIYFANQKLYAEGKALKNFKDYYFTNEQRQQICLTANNAVEACLKSPKSAEFPAWTEWKIGRDDDRTIVVSSYVDAKNAFNATIRNNFSVRLTSDGKTPIQIIIGGKEVYNIK